MIQYNWISLYCINPQGYYPPIENFFIFRDIRPKETPEIQRKRNYRRKDHRGGLLQHICIYGNSDSMATIGGILKHHNYASSHHRKEAPNRMMNTVSNVIHYSNSDSSRRRRRRDEDGKRNDTDNHNRIWEQKPIIFTQHLANLYTLRKNISIERQKKENRMNLSVNA